MVVYPGGMVPGYPGTMVHLPGYPWDPYADPPGPVRALGTPSSLCGTEAGPRVPAGKHPFSAAFPGFPALPPNKTESISQLLSEKRDPAPNKTESGRSGFGKPDPGIHARKPIFPVFLTLLIRTVG